MNTRIKALAVFTLVSLGGCAVMPTGPSVLALPGTGRTFDEFRVDDANCRSYAYETIGGQTAEQAQVASGVGTAALGTLLGAAAGAAIGGGHGAAAGAGLGLLGGSITGAQASSATGQSQQERFDNAYVQCMYAGGHRVPVWGNFAESALAQPPPPPPADTPPPPPPGTPPSPPIDATGKVRLR
jgi:hypothetical protein